MRRKLAGRVPVTPTLALSTHFRAGTLAFAFAVAYETADPGIRTQNLSFTKAVLYR